MNFGCGKEAKKIFLFEKKLLDRENFASKRLKMGRKHCKERVDKLVGKRFRTEFSNFLTECVLLIGYPNMHVLGKRRRGLSTIGDALEGQSPSAQQTA